MTPKSKALAHSLGPLSGVFSVTIGDSALMGGVGNILGVSMSSVLSTLPLLSVNIGDSAARADVGAAFGVIISSVLSTTDLFGLALGVFGVDPGGISCSGVMSVSSNIF